MKVKRRDTNKTEDALDSVGVAGAITGGGIGGLALQDYYAYRKKAKEALKHAKEVGIEAPGVDITEKANKERIKSISKRDFAKLNKWEKGAKNLLARKELNRPDYMTILEEIYPKGHARGDILKQRVDASINATKANINQIEAAKRLKSARRTGRVALGVGAVGAGSFAVKAALEHRRKNRAKK